ncbi:hypothetical protein LTR85_010233 [Meristemomyces frigidus]|nr:hypothetical protein LTR85_010233 [Meristemomyces frigidus]
MGWRFALLAIASGGTVLLNKYALWHGSAGNMMLHASQGGPFEVATGLSQIKVIMPPKGLVHASLMWLQDLSLDLPECIAHPSPLLFFAASIATGLSLATYHRLNTADEYQNYILAVGLLAVPCISAVTRSSVLVTILVVLPWVVWATLITSTCLHVGIRARRRRVELTLLRRWMADREQATGHFDRKAGFDSC